MKPLSGILTLLTDFGWADHYVAAMKGVVLGQVPEVKFVDITHLIGPQNIQAGAFTLSQAYRSFPEGTVHLAVVDPGVGTTRQILALTIDGHWFVGPDNGLFSLVLQGRPPERAFQILPERIAGSAPVSSTFHGRDLMAPAVAHLLLGKDPVELGPAVTELVRLPLADPRRTHDEPLIWLGHVLAIDHYGNVITTIPAEDVQDLLDDQWMAELGSHCIAGPVRTYADRPLGSLIVLIGSHGYVEVAQSRGHAASRLNAKVGQPIRLVVHKRSRV